MKTALTLLIAAIIALAAPTAVMADHWAGNAASHARQDLRNYGHDRHGDNHRHGRYFRDGKHFDRRGDSRWHRHDPRTCRTSSHRHHRHFRPYPVRTIYYEPLPVAPYFSISLNLR